MNDTDNIIDAINKAAQEFTQRLTVEKVPDYIGMNKATLEKYRESSDTDNEYLQDLSKVINTIPIRVYEVVADDTVVVKYKVTGLKACILRDKKPGNTQVRVHPNTLSMVPLQEFIDLSECIEIVSDKSVPMLGYEFVSFFFKGGNE